MNSGRNYHHCSVFQDKSYHCRWAQSSCKVDLFLEGALIQLAERPSHNLRWKPAMYLDTIEVHGYMSAFFCLPLRKSIHSGTHVQPIAPGVGPTCTQWMRRLQYTKCFIIRSVGHLTFLCSRLALLGGIRTTFCEPSALAAAGPDQQLRVMGTHWQ